MSLPWSRGRSSPACRRDSWPICGSRPPSCPLAVSVFILASSSAPIPLSIASDLDSRVLHSKSRVSVTFYLFKWHCPLGIYVESVMVGFVMYNTQAEADGSYSIYSMMMDARYQGKGYGTTALRLVF